MVFFRFLYFLGLFENDISQRVILQSLSQVWPMYYPRGHSSKYPSWTPQWILTTSIFSGHYPPVITRAELTCLSCPDCCHVFGIDLGEPNSGRPPPSSPSGRRWPRLGIIAAGSRATSPLLYSGWKSFHLNRMDLFAFGRDPSLGIPETHYNLAYPRRSRLLCAIIFGHRPTEPPDGRSIGKFYQMHSV